MISAVIADAVGGSCGLVRGMAGGPHGFNAAVGSVEPASYTWGYRIRCPANNGGCSSSQVLNPSSQFPNFAHLLFGNRNILEDSIGDEVSDAVENLSNGGVVLLENVRFYSEETENDLEFANKLGSFADVFVNDAFGTAHRAHASTSGVTKYLQDSVMGFLLEKELQYLEGELKDPESPFVVILGGKKVSDKIGVIEALIDKADVILIGGAMQYAFRKAQEYSIGESYVVDEDIPIAKALLEAVSYTHLTLPTKA